MRMYDYFTYKPEVGDVLVLKTLTWLNDCTERRAIKTLAQGEILVVIDAKYQTSIVFLSKDGLVCGAGICGDISRRIWNKTYSLTFQHDECNLNNSNDKIS
jgi:hypothetical protein